MRIGARTGSVALLLAAVALALLALGPARDRAVPRPIGGSPSPAAISALVGKVDRAYWARDSDGGPRLANRRHGITATFGANGPRLRMRESSVGLELRALGRGDALRGVADVPPRADASRVEYRRGPVTEWYLNGPAGIEQGFTLPDRVRGTGALTLSLATSGDLVPRLDRDRTGLTLGSGLAYRGLWAGDARGRDLPAWLELRRDRLLLRVDDTGARYPLTIDPVFQSAKLTASTGVADDRFGRAVAISGNTAVVGAEQADAVGFSSGAAYVFVKPASGWADATQVATLTASDGAPGEFLGASVAIAGGDTIVAGAPFQPTTGLSQLRGAAYVFVKPPGGWTDATEDAKLTASDANGADQFGRSVAVSSGVVIVGSPVHPNNTRQGNAYVFVSGASGWADATETAKLTASDGAGGDSLGYSVAIAGATAVAGAPGDNTSQGAVYVFLAGQSGWASGFQTAKLTASDGVANDYLGSSVGISGDTVVAGAPMDHAASNSNEGSVYVFLKSGPGWANGTQTAKLTASDHAAGDQLGTSVAVSDNIVVGGALYHDVGANANQGAAYEWIRPTGGWTDMTQSAEMTAAGGGVNDNLGQAVSISGDSMLAGAHQPNGNGPGAAYVFIEDASPPGPPVFAATIPGSPASETNPRITGSAEAFSTVRLYADAACASAPAGQGTASEFASAGVQVTVAAGTTATFHATATDRAGNVSPCSVTSISYTAATPIGGGTPVGGTPGTPSGGGTPVPPQRILSEVATSWSAGPRFTKVLRLIVRDVPAGGAVEIRCSAPKRIRRGCPFKRKAVPVKRGRAVATGLFRGKRLKSGATLEVRITKTGMIGKVVRYPIRPSRLPKGRRLCLPVGSTTPVRC
jgi:hypothetical protein